MAFEDRLRSARKNAKLTQEQAAACIGIAKSTWAGYESGNSQPDITKVVKIMNALHVDANYLWQDYFTQRDKKAPADQQELTENERELLMRYRAASPESQEAIYRLAECAAKAEMLSSQEDSFDEFLADKFDEWFYAQHGSQVHDREAAAK